MNTPTKQKLLNDWDEYISAELFITDRTDLINDEIYNNCIEIGLPNELAKEVSTEDIQAFLSKVKLNRIDQLRGSSCKIDLLYYLWFDEMAGQLRFNFINANHTKPPFRCNLILVDDEKEIIDSFINSEYLDGIPWNEFTIIPKGTKMAAAGNSPFNLKVYQQLLTC